MPVFGKALRIRVRAQSRDLRDIAREADDIAQRETIRAESPTPNEAPERAHSAYAGQASGLVREVKPAAAIIADILREAEDVLARLAR